MVAEDLRHAQTCILRPETHVYACLRSSPTFFDLKKPIYKVLVFLSKHGGGRPETCINVRFRL